MRSSIAGLILLAALLPAQARADVPTGTPFVTSSRLPIRVFYEKPEYQTFAEQFVTQAEIDWDLQITGAGFTPPLRTTTATIGSGDIEEGFDAYISILSQQTAFTRG